MASRSIESPVVVMRQSKATSFPKKEHLDYIANRVHVKPPLLFFLPFFHACNFIWKERKKANKRGKEETDALAS